MDAEMESALRFIDNDLGLARRAVGIFKLAMKQGYATSPQKGTIAELPGSKTIEYRHDKWRLLDLYYVGIGGEYSGGMTTIWYGPVPLWVMQYLGYYTKEAIPCLKAALQKAYLAEQFNGGRGPDCFLHEGYVYTNNVADNGFITTSGVERIFDTVNGIEVGEHRYQARWLVDRSADREARQ